jgi:tetratricopeptide (TPR) repeat protein
MTHAPELRHRDGGYSLRDTPWFFGLVVGAPIGFVFFMMFTIFWRVQFSGFRLLGATAGGFLIAFALWTLVQKGSRAVVDKLFGWGGEPDPVDVARNALLSHIEQFDHAGDGRQANRLRVELIDKGLAVNPAVVCFQIGRVFEETVKSPREALQWYRRCLAAGEENNAHFREAQQRVELLKDAVRADDADRQAREIVIADAIGAGDDARAEAAIADLARLHPHGEAPQFFRGLLASHRDAHALAAGHYREALAVNPGNEKAAFNLAVALTKTGDFVAARAAWRDFLAKYPATSPEFAQAARAALAEIDERSQTELDLHARDGEPDAE